MSCVTGAISVVDQLPNLAACEDRDGNLIVGTWNDGLYWFDGRATRPGSASNRVCPTIPSSRSRSIGTAVCGSAPTAAVEPRETSDPEVLEGSEGAVVQSLCEDGQGLWIGCNGNRIDLLTNGSVRRFQLVPVHPWKPRPSPCRM